MSLTQINKAGLDEIALDHVFTIGASGTSAYTFQGEGLNGTVNNPTLYLTRGKTYRFENGTGGHPIRIQSADNGTSGTLYNTGVTGNNSAGTVIVEVQHDAPDILYYQCASHASMKGILYITGALADGGVTTAKLADNSVTTAKIPTAAVTHVELANDSVITARIADGAVTAAKLGGQAVTTAKIANGAVTTVQIGDSSVSTQKIQDEAVTLAKLPHGTPAPNGTAGKFLRANNGADPTFEHIPETQTLVYPNGNTAVTVSTNDVVEITGKVNWDNDPNNTYGISFDAPTTLTKDSNFTLPEDGTNGQVLKTNGSGVLSFGDIPAGVGGATGADFNDNVKIRFGDSNDLEIYHAGGDSKIEHTTSGTDLRLITSGSGDDILIQPNDDFLVQVAGATKNAIICRNDGATELYHQGNSNSEKKFVTTDTGARVENTSSPLTSANSSANEFVVTGDGAMGMTLHTTSTTSNCGIHFADGTSGNATYRGTIIYRHNHDQLRFGVNGGTLAQQINSDLTVSFQNTLYAPSFYTTSDLTLKSNLVSFTNTLDKLKEVNGYTFDMKVGEAKDITIASAGIIAQDVEKVFPELVSTETGSDYKTVQYNGLIGVLVEAVKELTTKVESLESRLAILEAKL